MKTNTEKNLTTKVTTMAGEMPSALNCGFGLCAVVDMLADWIEEIEESVTAYYEKYDNLELFTSRLECI